MLADGCQRTVQRLTPGRSAPPQHQMCLSLWGALPLALPLKTDRISRVRLSTQSSPLRHLTQSAQSAAEMRGRAAMPTSLSAHFYVVSAHPHTVSHTHTHTYTSYAFTPSMLRAVFFSIFASSQQIDISSTINI